MWKLSAWASHSDKCYTECILFLFLKGSRYTMFNSLCRAPVSLKKKATTSKSSPSMLTLSHIDGRFVVKSLSNIGSHSATTCQWIIDANEAQISLATNALFHSVSVSRFGHRPLFIWATPDTQQGRGQVIGLLFRVSECVNSPSSFLVWFFSRCWTHQPIPSISVSSNPLWSRLMKRYLGFNFVHR